MPTPSERAAAGQLNAICSASEYGTQGRIQYSSLRTVDDLSEFPQKWHFAVRKRLLYPSNCGKKIFAIVDFRTPIANSAADRWLPS
jgi:hypothetical protein